MTEEETDKFAATMKEIKDLQEFFTLAFSQLHAGKLVSMSGVDKRISVVCQAAQNAAAEQQKAYLPELTILIKLLNEYESELRKLQSSLAAEVVKGTDDGASS